MRRAAWKRQHFLFDDTNEVKSVLHFPEFFFSASNGRFSSYVSLVGNVFCISIVPFNNESVHSAVNNNIPTVLLHLHKLYHKLLLLLRLQFRGRLKQPVVVIVIARRFHGIRHYSLSHVGSWLV